MQNTLKNRFSVSEWCGAVGDLGAMLPLAFALVIFNRFPPQRLFFLWGLIYVVTGLFYRVPLSVQPLKAMAVIAIAAGFSVAQLSDTAVFYGLLMILLSATGAIRLLERWFTAALVHGVQLGIGLILLQKALVMIYSEGLYFGQENTAWLIKVALLLSVVLVLIVVQFKREIPVAVFIIAGSIVLTQLFVHLPDSNWPVGSVVQFKLPQFDFFFTSLIFLMIPQTPLTLGNAVFAARDACHTFWPERAARINVSRLGYSIGISNVFIGLLGGFPICHGAGGIAAHAKFGGKTGGTTIIVGSLLVLIALVKPLTGFLFYIPIPILGALLLFTSWSLIVLVKNLPTRIEFFVAVIVGVLSFATRNLTVALLTGLVLHYSINFINERFLKGKASSSNLIDEPTTQRKVL